MTKSDVIKNIKDKFPDSITKFHDKSYKRIFIDVKRESLPDIAQYVFEGLGARFNIASAVDTPNDIEILYHFTIDKINLIISLRVFLDRKDPHIKSLACFTKGAEWIEREIHELFGVEFEDHPNLKPLLLPDNWPKDKHPLRRDFKQ